MTDMPPPIPIDVCDRCGDHRGPRDSSFLEHCEHCEIDIELDRKRPALYEALGIPLWR